MARSLTSTAAGSTADYVPYLYGDIIKIDKLNEPTLLDFSLASVENAAFVKLVRGNFITFNTNTHGKWFTGYIQRTPEPVYAGVNASGQAVWLYNYEAASEDTILNFQPLGLIPPYTNTTMGAIIKDLVSRLYPSHFNVTGITAGRTVSIYQVDPQKKFSDIVKEFCAAAHYRFYCNDTKLYFEQQDTTPATITIDGNNKYFTPDRLSIKPSPDAVLNDVTVVGAVEPQEYVNEYFVSDGYTAKYQCISDVYGATQNVFLDEVWPGSSIDTSKWAIQDASGTKFTLSNGFLNCVGGSNNGSWDVFIRSVAAYPLEGNLRLTHGEFDFVSASSGMIASIWNTASIVPALTGCIYGLKCSKSGTSTIINPVVNGTTDTSQGITLSDYSVRYVIRTVVNFSRVYRMSPEYRYIDGTGVVGGYGGGTYDDVATFTTLITVVDPTTGKTTRTFGFTNSATITAASSLAFFYSPIISDDMHVTTTSTTLSIPTQLNLIHADLLARSWRVTGPQPGDISSTADAFHFANQSTALTGQSVSAFVSNFSGDSAARAGVMVRQSTAVGSMYVAALMAPNGDVYFQYRDTLNGATVTNGPYINRPSGVFLKVTHADPNTTFPTAYYSDDGVNWTLINQASSVLMVTSYLAGFCVAGHGTVQTTYANFSSFSLPNMLASPLVTGTDIGTPTVGGSTLSSAVPQSQIVGPNEIDAQDGLAPIATILQLSSGASQAAYNGTFYKPGSSEIAYFKDTQLLSTTVPLYSTLIRAVYRGAGPAVGRIKDPTSITAEATAWGDNGKRSAIRTDLSPKPRTSSDCMQAAAALIKMYGYQHYDGSYTHYNLYNFTGEPKSGTILQFTNMNATAFPGLVAEAVQEVKSKFISASPQEIFEYEVDFGRPDLLTQFLSNMGDPKYNVAIPFDANNMPAYVNLASVATAFAPDVTVVTLTNYDATSWYWSILNMTAPVGGGFEVRYTDQGWSTTLDGKNLVTRTSSTTFTTPRQIRGRTVYVRAYDSSGNYSQFSAIARANLPLPPAPPLATIDYTNPVKPIISIKLPGNLTDVWGVEVRGADNVTILYKDTLTNTGLQQITFTDTTNLTLNMNYYVYTWNLLNEKSTAFNIAINSPYVTPVTPVGQNMLVNPGFEKTDFGEAPNVIRTTKQYLEIGWFVN